MEQVWVPPGCKRFHKRSKSCRFESHSHLAVNRFINGLKGACSNPTCMAENRFIKLSKGSRFETHLAVSSDRIIRSQNQTQAKNHLKSIAKLTNYILLLGNYAHKKVDASWEDWTPDPWFTRPVLYHWAKEAADNSKFSPEFFLAKVKLSCGLVL